MVTLFFLTVLVLTTRTPELGWVQYTLSYADKKICEDVIRSDHDKIVAGIEYQLGKEFKLVREMRCRVVGLQILIFRWIRHVSTHFYPGGNAMGQQHRRSSGSKLPDSFTQPSLATADDFVEMGDQCRAIFIPLSRRH